jgi:hypothetical protein
VVQIGLAFLLVSTLGLMATISPSLSSLPFALSLAGFGVGIGLSISQLGNVVMSSVGESRSSEAGGVQGASQNLGQSLGTALIGAVLLTGLTTGFHTRVLADPAIPAQVQEQAVNGTKEGLPMVSQAQFKSSVEAAGVPAPQASSLIAYYNESQIEALKRALLVASGFVLVGMWFARSLPGEALAKDEGEELLVPTD